MFSFTCKHHYIVSLLNDTSIFLSTKYFCHHYIVFPSEWQTRICLSINFLTVQLCPNVQKNYRLPNSLAMHLLRELFIQHLLLDTHLHSHVSLITLITRYIIHPWECWLSNIAATFICIQDLLYRGLRHPKDMIFRCECSPHWLLLWLHCLDCLLSVHVQHSQPEVLSLLSFILLLFHWWSCYRFFLEISSLCLSNSEISGWGPVWSVQPVLSIMGRQHKICIFGIALQI